jgi:hypothetical protein
MCLWYLNEQFGNTNQSTYIYSILIFIFSKTFIVVKSTNIALNHSVAPENLYANHSLERMSTKQHKIRFYLK